MSDPSYLQILCYILNSSLQIRLFSFCLKNKKTLKHLIYLEFNKLGNFFQNQAQRNLSFESTSGILKVIYFSLDIWIYSVKNMDI